MKNSEIIKGLFMAAIPPGTFSMGHLYKNDPEISEKVNVFYSDEQPIHEVSLKTFLIGETQITQGQYKEITGSNPSTFTGDDKLPVTNIGPHEIIAFCNELSRISGFDPCYEEDSLDCDLNRNGFRMPTEAEWEYACRAGTTTHYYTGNTENDLDKAGWYLGNSHGKTHPVAQKEPNAWGLYDMHGNVFEYCTDDWNPSMCYNKYLSKNETVPPFKYYHNLNITRGGSWFSEPSVCRSAARSCFCNWKGINQSYYMGFRIAQNAV